MYSSEFCSVGLQVYNLKSPNLLLDEVYHNILFSVLILFRVGHIGTKWRAAKTCFFCCFVGKSRSRVCSRQQLQRKCSAQDSLGKSLGCEGLEKSNSPL
jgi:hypothetical protein